MALLQYEKDPRGGRKRAVSSRVWGATEHGAMTYRDEWRGACEWAAQAYEKEKKKKCARSKKKYFRQKT